MATTDKRVVEMQFDNRDFERNVAASMSTLDKLKEKLNFSNASDSFEKIGRSADKVDMSGLSNGIDKVGLKFDALYSIADTVFSRLTNAALDFGGKISSFFNSLTVTPISTGLQEYETQINAIQTIIANTQSRQKEVDKELLQSINLASEEAAAALKNDKKEQLSDIQEYYSERLKLYRKESQKEIDLARDQNSEELDLLEEKQFEELSSLKKLKEETKEIYSDLAEAELEVVEKKYDEEQTALEKAIRDETRALEEAHREKLDMYEEEYMEKLKVIDEDRYNRIKEIDDQIDAINALRDAEEEERKQKEQTARLAELQNEVNSARTIKDRAKAEQALSDYQDKLEQERIEKERKQQINSLKTKKEEINEEYKLAKDELKQEYDAKKEAANEEYELAVQEMKDEQQERIKLLKETYEEEKKFIKDNNELQWKNFEEEIDAQIEALQKKQKEEKKALIEQHEDEIESLEDIRDANLEAIEAEQKAAKKALEANHELALQNIEAERNAKIAAASAAVEGQMTDGSTIGDVSKALDELNEYADKTIYNFTEMTRNIGTFTAAGIDLGTSVDAIKGIANLGAVSGSNSEQVSRAMYQISQALAAGTVKLMDWNSIVNAGMGGQILQDALKQTARVHGIEIDKIIAKQGSFRESLQTGWVTSEILLETLQKFAGDMTEEELLVIGYTEDQVASIIELGKTANDAATKVKTVTQLIDTLQESAQSGWTNTWEYIIGDFYEAREFLTDISDYFGAIIGQSADSRNQILSDWKELGGRDNLIKSFWNIVDGLTAVANAIREAFYDIFPATTGEKLADFSKKFEDLTGKFKAVEGKTDQIKRTFEGLFAIVDLIADLFGGAFKAGIGFVNKLLGKSNFSVLDLTASIGDNLVVFHDWVEENFNIEDALNKIGDAISFVIDKIKGWIEAVRNIPEVKSFIEEASKYFSDGGEVISEFIARVKEIDELSLDSISKVFSDFYNNVLGYFVNPENIFESFEKAIDTLTTKVTNYFETLGTKFSEFKQKITDTIAESPATFESIGNGLKQLAGPVVAIVAGAFITSFGSKIGSFIAALANPLEGIGDILKSVGKYIKSSANEKNANAIRSVAISIGILAASLIALSLVPQEKLEVGFGYLIQLVGIIGGAALALGALDTALQIISTIIKNLGGVAEGMTSPFASILSSLKDAVKGFNMIAISISAMIFAAAMKKLTEALQGMGEVSFGSVMKFMLVLTSVLEGYALLLFLSKSASGLSLLAVPISLILMMKALENVAKFDTDVVLDNIGGLALVFGSLIAAVKIISGSKGEGSNVAWTLVGLAVAIDLLVFAIEKLSEYSTSELVKSGGAIAALEIVSAIATVITKIGGENVGKAGGTMILMAGAILITTLAIQAIKDIPKDDLAYAKWVIIELEAVFAGATALAGQAKGSSWKSIATMAAVVGILTIAVSALSLIGGERLEQAAQSLSILMAAFGAMTFLSDLSKNNIEWGTIIKMVASFGIIAAGVAVLALIPNIDKTLNAALGISAILIAMAGAAWILSSITNDIDWKLIAEVGALAVIGTAVIGLVGLLEKYDLTPSIETAGVFAILLGTISGVALLLSAITNDIDWKLIAEVGAIGIIGTIITGLVGTLEKYDLTPSIETAIAFGILLSSLAVTADLMIPLSQVKHVNGGAILEILGIIALVIGAVGVIAEGLGALFTEFPTLEEYLDKGIDILVKVGMGVGEIAVALIAGIGVGLMDGLVEMADRLTTFGEKIKPFIESLSGIDESAVQSGKSLAATILMFTGAELLSAITSFITGDADMVNFAMKLTSFGEGLKSYGEVIKGIDSKAIEDSIPVAENVIKINDMLPKEGGLVGLLFGNHDLGAFGTSLSALGLGLWQYSKYVSAETFDADAIGNSIAPLSSLIDLNSEYKSDGVVSGWLFGGHDFTKFGASLEDLASSLVEYSDNLPDNYSKINQSVTAIEPFVAISERLKSIDLDKIENFGKKVKDFGIKYKDFYDKIKGIEKTKVDNVVASVNDLITSFTNATLVDSTKIDKFTSSVSNSSTTAVNKFIGGFDNAHIRTEDAIVQYLNCAEIAFSEGSIGLIDQSSNTIDSMLNVLTGSQTSMYNTSSDLFKQIPNGYSFATDPLVTNSSNLAANIVTSFTNKKTDMYNAGSGFGTSFSDGLKSTWQTVKDSVGSFGSNILNWFKEKLDINSPSKETEEIGKYVALGFAKGIDEYATAAYQSTEDIAEEAKKGLSEAASVIKNSINDNVDANPVIRPVLDLSNIENGAAELYSLTHGGSQYRLNGLTDTVVQTSYWVNKGAQPSVTENVATNFAPGNGNTYNNTFNITGSNPKEIANEVSRILRHQVERKGVSWA